MHPSSVILLGYGSIGRRHAREVAGRDMTLFVVDTDSDVRCRVNEDHPEATAVASLEDLELYAPDWRSSVAIIATWGPSHAKLFHEIADRGVKRILCEKPLASSVQDAYEMCNRAEEEGITLTVNHNFRYLGLCERVREFEERFDLGPPVGFLSTAGAVCLIGKGIHFVDLASSIFQCRPTEVISTARSAPINPRSERLGYFGGTTVLSFGDGREAVLSYNNRSSVTQRLMILYRNAVLDFDYKMNLTVRHRDHDAVARFPKITRHGPADLILYAGDAGLRENPLGIALDDVMGDGSLSPGILGRDAVMSCIAELVSSREKRSIGCAIDHQSDIGCEQWPIT